MQRVADEDINLVMSYMQLRPMVCYLRMKKLTGEHAHRSEDSAEQSSLVRLQTVMLYFNGLWWSVLLVQGSAVKLTIISLPRNISNIRGDLYTCTCVCITVIKTFFCLLVLF